MYVVNFPRQDEVEVQKNKTIEYSRTLRRRRIEFLDVIKNYRVNLTCKKK